MVDLARPRGRWRLRSAAGATVALGAAVAGALPASGHASFPSAAAAEFAPNTYGGSGAAGAAAPYLPGQYVTIHARVPFEQTVKVNGSDDTSVDIKVIVPAGWTNPSCGSARTNRNDAGTNSTNQPGNEVVGWTCTLTTELGHDVLHWTGPQVAAPETSADSAQFFSFSVTTPSPTVQTTYNGKTPTEGFIVDQLYAGGRLVRWIPDATYTGTVPVGAETEVATGLARTVAGTTPASQYHPLSPTRVLDSRTTTGGWTAPLAAGTPGTLVVAGAGKAAPADADAVVLNVTATDATIASYLTVYPTGTTAPTASNLNFVAGQTVPNLVVAKVGTGGSLSFAVGAGTVNVVADVVGYFSAAAGGRYTALTPTRVLDSRTTTGGWTGALTAGADQALAVRGVGGVSSTADAVILNVTATGGTTSTFVTAYPSGETAPTASNLNVTAGQTVANLVIAKVGTDGKVAFSTGAGSVHVVADVVGSFDATSGSYFHVVAPGRILDSRTTNGGWASTPLASGAAKALKVRGFAGVRADATAVIANVTVTEPTADGYLTVFPNGVGAPTASNLNFTAAQTVPNLVAVGIGSGGSIAVSNFAGTAHVIADVVGYFAAT